MKKKLIEIALPPWVIWDPMGPLAERRPFPRAQNLGARDVHFNSGDPLEQSQGLV